MPARATYADDQQLTHYLLGLLSDDDTERIDEAAVVDDDVAARLRVVEHDVVDAYVRGRLPATLIGQFESRYLSSSRRREQVACAARFLRAVDRAAGAEPEAGAPTEAPDYEPQPPAQPAALLEHDRASRKRRALRLVAAVFVLAACGTLLFESLRSRPRADAAPNPIATAGQPSHEAAQARGPVHPSAEAGVEPRPSDASAFRDTSHVRESKPSRATAVDPAEPARRATPADAPVSALVLLPQTRAAGPVATIAIPASATRARFDLRLESNEYSGYHAALTDPASNQILWRSGTLTAAAPHDETPTVSVIVPARLLKTQHYSLALGGSTTAHTTEIVGSYTFRVVRP